MEQNQIDEFIQKILKISPYNFSLFNFSLFACECLILIKRLILIIQFINNEKDTKNEKKKKISVH